MDLIEINNDLFNIASRVKEIGDYTLKFNRRLFRYEIHSKFGLELTLGSKPPTANDLYKIRKTRLENRKKLIEEIERYNALLEKEKEKEFISQMEQAYGS